MDRQALPSIILSVSIVCFFAVALYERDAGPRRMATHERVKESGRADIQATGQRHVPPDELAARGTTSSPAGGPIEAGGAGRGVARKPGPPEDGRAPARASTERTGEAPLQAIRMASNRKRNAPPVLPPPRRSSAAPPRATDVRLARAPFTIVGSGETIADVARRVYGTTGDAGALWRANRDILGKPDSPLAPGTVLRTPAATPR